MGKTLNTAASSEEVAVEKVASVTENTSEEVMAGEAIVESVAPDEGSLKEVVSEKTKKLKVKFLLSPTGKFGLGYNIGEVASFPGIQAEELIEAGYAKLVK